MMNRRNLGRMAATLAVACSMVPWSAMAADEAPDALIKRLSTEVISMVRDDKAIQAGDINKVITLVDKVIMPNVNFRRMTAAAVGPGWRKASPEQQKRLQDEFKILLVRTYAGALAQVSDQTITMKPMRAAADDKDVLVRTEITGRGDPIQLDYRLEKPRVRALAGKSTTSTCWACGWSKPTAASLPRRSMRAAWMASSRRSSPATRAMPPRADSETSRMLVLPSELTHEQASACLRMLVQGLKVLKGPQVVVDASALAVFDTSALAVLLECRREVLADGKAFVVKGLPPALVGMAGLYGVDALLQAAS